MSAVTAEVVVAVLDENGGPLLDAEWKAVAGRWSPYGYYRSSLGELVRGELKLHDYRTPEDGTPSLLVQRLANDRINAKKPSKPDGVETSSAHKFAPLLARCLFVRFVNRGMWESDARGSVVAALVPNVIESARTVKNYLAP